MRFIRKGVVLLVIFIIGVGMGYLFFLNNPKTNQQQTEKNTPKAFISEIYDKIKENYWNNISEAELLDLFKLSIDKNGGQSTVAKFTNKEQMLKAITENANAAAVAQTVLASLQPAGRSGLYTQKLEAQLKNTVENINPDKDLYKDLGLAKGASEEDVNKTYSEQAKELEKQQTPEAKEKLKQLTYAREVLTQKDKKEKYDQKGIEPTIFSKVIEGNILYVQFKKFSPTSLEEFQKAFEVYKDNAQLTSSILDLRGNVGGAIDSTAYFLGFFLGKNQNAFEFYHKGEYLPFKTPTEKLASLQKYKQIVILVDENTQSSAEMMAGSFKKYNIGKVLGTTTKGWGTVERVFPLDNQINQSEKYSIFLVHSITLRNDNQPIEGRGVEPDINIKSPDWENQLFNYFRNQQLIQAIKTIL